MASMNGLFSVRPAGTKAPAPTTLPSNGRPNGNCDVLDSQRFSALQSTAVQARANIENQDSGQTVLLGPCDRGQDAPELQKQSANNQAKLQEVEKRGTAKPNYRGVRQRPWGDFPTAFIFNAAPH